MARTNALFPAWNRGLISPKALGRVDLDRTRLSAEIMNNFLPSTQGAMSIRPGTKWFGSSLRDSGAEFLEFVASTDDVALLELTDGAMRVWLGEAHEIALLSRPKVDTTVSLSDTGWSNASTGGNASTSSTSDLIPTMSAAITNGVTITASSEWTATIQLVGFGDEAHFEDVAINHEGWRVGDDSTSTWWQDTGDSSATTIPSWVNVDFGSGNAKNVGSYSMRATVSHLDNMAKNWELLGSNYDTGTYATDTGKWTLEDSRTNQSTWGASEKRTYTLTDTGTPGPWRHWRIHVTALDGDTELEIAEIEMFQAAAVATSQATFSSGQLTLNATSVGALAKATKHVIVSDTGTEHSLDVYILRGPVTLRVGSTNGDDDFIREASLGTGYHNLAFTPTSDFWITLQSSALVNRIVGSLSIGDSGTVEITTPWGSDDIGNVRYDQSADVVYVDCDGIRPSKIERRGTGRSWGVVDYAPNNGPFLPAASSSAKLSVSHFFGNTTLNSDIPLFNANHAGSLVRIFHEGQKGQWRLGAFDAKTDAIEVTGIGSDTGTTPGTDTERTIVFTISGSWAGTLTIERSFDGSDLGFKAIPAALGDADDTGSFTRTIRDLEDNIKVWYRARVTSYTSGVAVVSVSYKGGGITGIGRITDFQSSTAAGLEVLSRFSDTGASDSWQLGYWSDARGFPTAPALHGGRLGHAQGGSVFLSVADDYENFDDSTEGDAGPIIRTLGSGPVDAIRYMVSLLRLVVGTAGAELTVRSSSVDEPLTPDNASAIAFSTQGSANLRALKMDTRAIFVQRSGRRMFMSGQATDASAFGDYQASELTLLVPDLLKTGVVSVALQRQPDTRIHVVLGDGTVAILTYEPSEEVLCWSTWSTNGFVERAMVLPGEDEDAVYYHIRRTVGATTRRFLEKWAMESECAGDTGLTFLADCARHYSDTGRTTLLDAIVPHLAGMSGLVLWSDDTGSFEGVDRSPDVSGVQTTYSADTGGDIIAPVAVHHAVAGIPYQADWKSAKLSYGAEAGTAVGQPKRVPQVALCLYQTHSNGVFFGEDTGSLKPLPRIVGGAGQVDADKIFDTLDLESVSFPGKWSPDARVRLRAKSPRPCTLLDLVPSVATNERV